MGESIADETAGSAVLRPARLPQRPAVPYVALPGAHPEAAERRPRVATVVVVQSHDLSAWIGVAGVAVGVVLAAGIDWLRTRRAERKQMRQVLVRAGSDLAGAVSAEMDVITTATAAGAMDHPAWVALLQARGDELRTAYATIREFGVPELDKAAFRIVLAAADRSSPADPAAVAGEDRELPEALNAFWIAVRNAKL
jgi:hypothetical protein